jgi:hypothetical protein
MGTGMKRVMNAPLAAVPALLILALAADAAAQTSKPAAQVAVAPFVVEADKADALHSQSKRCFEQFAAALVAKGLKVAREAQLSEKNVRSAPAPWAVLGRMSHGEGMFQVELRLMEVATGEEMRLYFNSNKDPQVACGVVDKAAERIAVFVQEQRQ